MKINKSNNIINVTTLSIVLISTTTWRCSAGRNRTNLKTRSKRKVRNTEKPPKPLEQAISITLQPKNYFFCLIVNFEYFKKVFRLR